MEKFDAELCCEMSLAFNNSLCLGLLEPGSADCDQGESPNMTSSTMCSPRNMSEEIEAKCEDWYQGLVFEANKENLYESVPLLVFLVINQLVGLIGNALVVVVYLWKKHKTMTNHFMLILGTIDLLSCLILHPYIIHKVIRFYQPDVLACKVFEFLIHMSLGFQGNVMLVIAVDRFNAVCRPLLFLNTLKWNSKILSLLGAVSLFGSIPILKFYGHRYLPGTVQGKRVLLPICHYTDEYDGSADQGIFGMVVLGCLVVSIIAMVVLYTRVSYAVFRRRNAVAPTTCTQASISMPSREVRPITDPYLLTAMKEKHSVSQNSGDNQQAGPSSSSDCHAPRKSGGLKKPNNLVLSPESKPVKSPQRAWSEVQQPPAEKRVVSFSVSSAIDGQSQTNVPRARAISAAKMLVLVTAVFFLTWLPFWVIKISAMVVGGDMLKEPVYQRLLAHLFYTNNAINPFIYTFMNKNFINDVRGFLV